MVRGAGHAGNGARVNSSRPGRSKIKGTRAVRGRRKHVEKGKVFGARGRGVRHGRQRRRTNDGQGGRARGSVSGANSVELPAMGRESSTQRKGGEGSGKKGKGKGKAKTPAQEAAEKKT